MKYNRLVWITLLSIAVLLLLGCRNPKQPDEQVSNNKPERGWVLERIKLLKVGDTVNPGLCQSIIDYDASFNDIIFQISSEDSKYIVYSWSYGVVENQRSYIKEVYVTIFKPDNIITSVKRTYRFSERFN